MRSNRYDVWMPNLGPSEALLKARQAGIKTREAKRKGRESGPNDKQIEARESRKFLARYGLELFEGGTIDGRNQTIKNHGQKFTLRLLQKLGKRGNITLLCHCPEDAEGCHRHTLKGKLDGKI